MEKNNGELVKITDLTSELGLSSRSLRYYEQVGLIKSIRPEFEKYRYYTSENTERLKQIIILRKMQIPVKDILRIYESESMSVVVETFVSRIRDIENEIGALSELKSIVSKFLQTMLDNGITKISAIPLLYEEMDRQLELMEDSRPVNLSEIEDVSVKLAKPLDYSIVDLPPMRVLTSFLKPDTQISDFWGFSRYIQINGLSYATSGSHRRFEFQTEAGDVLMVRVPEDFHNDSDFLDYSFSGGLFAAVNVFLDEDLGQCFRNLVNELDINPYYQFAYCPDGSSRHPTLLENLISPDEKRELVMMLVPVKKRTANPELFDPPEELTNITLSEIESANPVLWETIVPLDKLTPINYPHYRFTEDGEAEYTGWISTRVLSTNVEVKLPFRVDVTFRAMSTGERFSYGDSEGSIILYHGDELSYYYGINMGNRRDIPEEALRFHQPVFKNRYNFNGRGRINKDEYNRLTWIIGEKHLAVFINDELRYCGTNFPYMNLDLNREKALPLIIGSNGQGMKYFREIKVSQLAFTPKNKIKKEELVMVTKQSNNIIPVIHRLVTDEHGENYWFNGCARYVMECLGEKDYDYEFFAGLTGDNFTQHYPVNKNYANNDATSSYFLENNGTSYVESIFEKCGYAVSYILGKDLNKNKEMYLQTLIGYLDKGIPVIVWCQGEPRVFGVFVGYEESGNTLLFIQGNNNEPQRISLENAMITEGNGCHGGWIFVGEKKEQKDLKQIYRETIINLPKLLTANTDFYYAGAEAFRAWINTLESCYFDNMKPDEFDPWVMYTNYICVLATNASCCHGFLERAMKLNPDMGYLEEVSRLYKRMGEMWNNDNGEDLEALGGGFNVTLEALQNKEQKSRIVSKIREFASVTNEIVKVLTKNILKK